MLISEIFYSIQGEGELTGVPSVFVRTAGCNLRCAWCDTPYASWKPEGKEMSVDAIVDEINKHPTRYVVLTGGEPMVAKDIHELTMKLAILKKHITIETAGTVLPSGISCHLASVSPKFSNSTPAAGTIEDAWIERHEERRWRPPVLSEWVTNYTHQFKLVVQSEADASEALVALQFGVPELKNDRIYLMPEGTDSETLSKRRSWLIDFCKQKGYRYCNRLHIELFGNTRGT